MRRDREDTSVFAPLFDYNRQRRAELSAEGRRPVLGGLLSKEPVMGTDTIRYEGIRPMLAGLLDPVARGIDAPRAASQGLIPAQDMIGEAFGTAGVATLGGGATVSPKGAIGSNALRKQITTEPEFRPETFYHGTRNDIDAFDPDMVDLGVHVGTVGQANQRLSHLIRRDDPTYTGPFDTFENIKGQGETSAFRTGAGPAENSQILPLRVRADYPLRMPDAGEWDRSEVVMYNIEKMLEDKNADPRLVEAFEDFDFDGLDDARAEYYDNTDWKGSYENREFLDDIRGRIKDAGYDSIVYKNMVESSGAEGVQDSMIVLDPQNIRSVNAKFDPSREYSSDLLAANASKSAGLLGVAADGRAPVTSTVRPRMRPNEGYWTK